MSTKLCMNFEAVAMCTIGSDYTSNRHAPCRSSSPRSTSSGATGPAAARARPRPSDQLIALTAFGLGARGGLTNLSAMNVEARGEKLPAQPGGVTGGPG